MSIDAGTIVSSMELNISPFRRGINEAVRHLEVFNDRSATMEQQLIGLGDSFESVGSMLTKAFSLPLAGVGTASVAAYAQFEETLNKVGTIADTTVLSMEDISQEIIALSNDNGVAATELNEALYQSISAGIDTGHAVEFVGEASKLAIGGFTDSATAVDVLTTAINAYGLSADDATRISDILLATQNKGKTTVGELGATLGRIIPVASSTNVSIEQLGAAMANLTADGVATAEASTYLKAMLSELSKSGTAADIALREATGHSFAELSASGQDMNDILQVLAQYAADSDVTLKDMFGSVEAGSAALILAKNNGEKFDRMLADMYNSAGATQAAVEQMDSGVNDGFEDLGNAVKNLAISFGEVLAPAVNDVVALVQTGVDWLNSLDEEQRKNIVSIAALVAGIGPVLSIGGRLISGAGSLVATLKGGIETVTMLNGVIHGTMSATGGWVTVLNTAKAAFGALTGPVGLTVAGISAFIAILKHLYDTNEEVRDGVDRVWGDIQTLISTVLDLLNGMFGDFTTKVEEVWSQCGEELKAITDVAFDALGKIVTVGLNGISEALELAILLIQGDWDGAWNKITELTDAAWEQLESLVEAGKQFVVERIMQLKNDAIAQIKMLPQAFMEAGQEMINGLIEGVEAKAAEAIEAIKNFGSNIASGFKRILGIQSPSRVFSQMGGYIVQGLADGIANNADVATSEMKTLAQLITSSGNAISTGLITIDEKTGQQSFDIAYKAVMGRVDLYYQDRDQRVSLMAEGTDENINQLQREIDATKDAYSIKMQLYQQEYLAQTALVDEQSAAEIKALQAQLDEINGLNEQDRRKEAAERFDKQMSEKEAKLAAVTSEEEKQKVLEEITELQKSRDKELLQQQRKDQQDALRAQMDVAREQADTRKAILQEELEAKQYQLQQQKEAELKKLDEMLKALKQDLKDREELAKVQTELEEKQYALDTKNYKGEQKTQTENRIQQLTTREAELKESIDRNQQTLQSFTPEIQKIANDYGAALLGGLTSTEGEIKRYFDSLRQYAEDSTNGAYGMYAGEAQYNDYANASAMAMDVPAAPALMLFDAGAMMSAAAADYARADRAAEQQFGVYNQSPAKEQAIIDYDKLAKAIAKEVKPSVSISEVFNSPKALSEREIRQQNLLLERRLVFDLSR